MKAWLKVGLIGLGVFVLLFILSMLLGKTSDMGNIFDWIILILGFPALILARFVHIGFLSSMGFSVFFVLLIPYSFALGALIGYLIGRFKK